MRIDRSRQQLYGMNERHVQTALSTPPGDLEEAARVRRRDHPRAGLDDTRELAFEQLARHAGLEEIVDARAAAAEVAVGKLDEPELGDPAQKLARLLPDPLAVDQVTGIVVRDRQIEGPERQVGAGQHFRDIANARGEARELGNPMAVLLHHRAAARGVGDDEIEVVGKRAGERARSGRMGIHSPGVKLEGTAAALRRGDHDFEAGQPEEASRVPVHTRVEVALNAARQEPDSPDHAAAGGDKFRERRRRGNVLEEGFHRREPRQPSQHAGRLHERSQPGALVELEERESRAQPCRLGKDREDERLEQSMLRRRPGATELRARRLEERAEPHARRARGFARATTETEVEMALEGPAQLHPALGRRPHQVDAAARRVHLFAEHPVGRTLREADPAVHALPDLVEVGSLGGARGGRHQRPPTKRPGFSTRFASNSSFSARMRAKGPASTGPHGSTVYRSSAGPRTMTTLPASSMTRARKRVVARAVSAALAFPTRTRNVPRPAQPLIQTSPPGAAVRTASPIARSVSASRRGSDATWRTAPFPSGVDARAALLQKPPGNCTIRAPSAFAIASRRSPCSRTASATLPMESATPAAAASTGTDRSARSLKNSIRFG